MGLIHVVLVEPEIPQNTGNIARTCAATGSVLHLVKPLGYSLDDRYMKRAGLDYWPLARVQTHECFAEVQALLRNIPFYYASARGTRGYADFAYPADVAFVFGRESRGLPEDMLRGVPDHCIRIPMIREARSLNLANSVAVVVYEALRQRGFAGLSACGSLGDAQDGAWTDYL